jgi:hypothetical protein
MRLAFERRQFTFRRTHSSRAQMDNRPLVAGKGMEPTLRHRAGPGRGHAENAPPPTAQARRRVARLGPTRTRTELPSARSSTARVDEPPRSRATPSSPSAGAICRGRACSTVREGDDRASNARRAPAAGEAASKRDSADQERVPGRTPRPSTPRVRAPRRTRG